MISRISRNGRKSFKKLKEDNLEKITGNEGLNHQVLAKKEKKLHKNPPPRKVV